MNRAHLILLILSAGACGCMLTSSEQIKTVIHQYETVNFADGIDVEEAKLIGQRSLIKRNMVKIYDLSQPQIMADVADLPNHEQYWFVSFKEKKFTNIEFVFVAIIHKQTGKVKFADDFQEDKRWILEAVLLGG